MQFDFLIILTLSIKLWLHLNIKLFCVFNKGPPGAGKTTIACDLAKKHGFIYYEADAFVIFCNPFMDPSIENPSWAVLRQKPVKVMIDEH